MKHIWTLFVVFVILCSQKPCTYAKSIADFAALMVGCRSYFEPISLTETEVPIMLAILLIVTVLEWWFFWQKGHVTIIPFLKRILACFGLNPSSTIWGPWSALHTLLLTYDWFIRSAKVSVSYFSIAILTWVMFTLALHMLILVC